MSTLPRQLLGKGCAVGHSAYASWPIDLRAVATFASRGGMVVDQHGVIMLLIEGVMTHKDGGANMKLIRLASMIKALLEDRFGYTANSTLETRKEWLLSTPSKALYADRWDAISDVYSWLVDHRWTLDQRLDQYQHQIQTYSLQRIDIWFAEPYNFIFEFDETQHFNQFRLLTLEHFKDYQECSLDYNHYVQLSKARVVKPGTSNFQKIKSFNPLFPPMLAGEQQDNRARQRAFRDFLKDIAPSMSGCNPTMRISYKISHDKIKDFTEDDILAVKNHILSQGFLDKIKL